MPANVVETDITDVSKAFAVLGFFIVVYGLVSYTAKDRLYLSESLIAVIFGIVTGPYVLGWVDPLSWADEATTNYVTYQFTRFVVGVQVLFTGISLPKAYLRKEVVSLTVLLIGVMSIAWVVTAALIYGIIGRLTFLECLCLSAAITPTDPVLANGITKGRFAEKHVPANVRNIIVAESGANDGLGFPFLYLALYLMYRNGQDAGTSVGVEVGRWIYAVVIYQIVLSVVYGFVAGFVARKTLRWAESRGYIDKDNFFAYGLGLALFVLGTTGLFGSDDILACFIAGNSFTWDDWFRQRTQEEEADSFQDILDMLLNASVFIYIGAIIPWGDFSYSNPELGLVPWRIVVLAIAILLLRRPPWVIALYKIIPALTTFREGAFTAWFGPIGVSAVFYIQVALRAIPDDGSRDRIRAVYPPLILWTVFASVLTHGSTVPVAKLGPTILRRTATLTRTRSITFSSNPPSRDTSLGPDEKMPWNPVLSLVNGLAYIFLFWRKDSFWRKESPTEKAFRRGDIVISGPTAAIRQKIMNEVASTPPTDQNESQETRATEVKEVPEQSSPTRGIRNVPARLELPLSDDGRSRATITFPEPAVPHKGEVHRSLLSEALRKAASKLEAEMEKERLEAREEREEGWQAAVRSAFISAEHQAERPAGQTPHATPPQSVPGTPGGSRVHFHTPAHERK